ncbi:D-sedoheptulose 7-phosphate isomerase [Catenulispora sp. MAP12-49]|uniref:D-sedoheptulose-7-phosphate isomerase n=1 Tax=Catenulispora sp. MAP12-49 TaxID=3156302 RepID=UPI0035114615
MTSESPDPAVLEATAVLEAPTVFEAPAVFEALHRRVAPIERLTEDADALAEACLAVARAFRAGGRLLVFGTGTAATDAQHVSVEFMHPVIVGKRALPAFSLAADSATMSGLAQTLGPDAVFAHQLRVLGRAGDIALGVCGDGDSPAVVQGLAAARASGLTTVALIGGDGGRIAEDGLADHRFVVRSDDHRVVKEGHVTLYHLLWELTHVYLEQPHALDSAATSETSPEAADGIGTLYPFLYSGTSSLEALTVEVAASARAKIAEIVALRRSVGQAEAASLAACAYALAEGFGKGATLLAFGNGGSSSDAQDIVHTFLDPGPGAEVTALPALCLTNDTAVVTALSNDVSFDVVFARQLQAVGRPGDLAVAVSTSGGSANVLAALAAARKAGMTTVGFAGYGGGKMAEPGLVDHLFAVPSSSVHRIQEVQTTLYHVLWEQVQRELRLTSAGPAPRTPRPGRD